MRKPLQSTEGKPRGGSAVPLVIVLFVALVAMTSLGVDLARVQLVKVQMRIAADAAARYGAFGLKNILAGQSAAASNATAAAADNIVDGAPMNLDPADIEMGIWDTSAKTFTSTTDPNAANAVRVTARHTAARGTAVPLLFAKLIGRPTCDITVQSIATVTGGTSIAFTVPATSNPFLAGEPAGTIASANNPANDPDYAGTSSNPRQSPLAANGVTLTPGASLTFDGVNGGANNFSSSTTYTADGNLGWLVNNYDGPEHGISDMTAPINSLVAVFLDDNLPDGTAAPANLDFSTTASRDFATLAPKLKQTFFIGDGRRDDGSVQQFIVPSGATRMFIATWDGYEWSNNIGSFSMTVHNPGTVATVR